MKTENYVGLCNKNQIEKEKLIESLDNVIQKGDPIFIMIFFGGDLDICRVPTKASLLKQSIESQSDPTHRISCLYTGEVPKIKPRSQSYYFVRWWLLPIMYMILCWVLLVHPQFYEDHWFKHTFFDPKNVTPVKKLLPIIPTDMLNAYDMGIACEKLDFAYSKGNQTGISYALGLLKELSGRDDDVSIEEAADIRNQTDLYVNKKSVWQKVWGFFTFINIIWMLSVIVLVISVGPCVWKICGPCIERLAKCFSGAVRRAIIWVAKEVLLPLATFMHNWGIFELFFYLLCFQLTLEGSQMDITEQFAFMLALMAFIFLVGVISYSTLLHTKRIRGFDFEKYLNVMLVWYILCAGPVTVVMQSTFFGYMVFACVFTLFGFRIVFFGLGYGCGWEDDDDEKTMESSAFCTFVLLLIYIPMRLCLPEEAQKYLSPFSSSVTVLGGNILLLAHLIMSSYNYRDSNLLYTDPKYRCKRWSKYLFHNATMLAMILTGILVGTSYGFEGLSNTAIVYLSLWAIEKFWEIQDATIDSGWVFVFFVAAFVCWGAIEINKHPGFVVAMF